MVEMQYSAGAPRVETKISEYGHTLTIKVMKSKRELFTFKSDVCMVFDMPPFRHEYDSRSHHGCATSTSRQWFRT